MNQLQHITRNKIGSIRKTYSAMATTCCSGIFPVIVHGNGILKLAKMFLLVTALFLSGCASGMLYESNEMFEYRHQRQIDFTTTQVEADYLGKLDGAYAYKVVDASKYEIVLLLPAENGKEVELYLDKSKDFKPTGCQATFYFLTDKEQSQEVKIDNTADFPEETYVDYYNDYHYSCKEGSFSNSLPAKEGYGLSASDSFVLGLRRMGYIATIPLDVAVTAPLIPIILISWDSNPWNP